MAGTWTPVQGQSQRQRQGPSDPVGELGRSVLKKHCLERGKSQKLKVEGKQLLGDGTDLATALSGSIAEEQRCSEVPMPALLLQPET